MGNDERTAKLDALTARLEAARRPIDEAASAMAGAQYAAGIGMRKIAAMAHAPTFEWSPRVLEAFAYHNRTLKGKTRVKSIRPKRQEWISTERALADHIVDLYKEGKLVAAGERDAVLRYASQYVKLLKNGKRKPIKPESLWRSYYQRNR